MKFLESKKYFYRRTKRINQDNCTIIFKFIASYSIQSIEKYYEPKRLNAYIYVIIKKIINFNHLYQTVKPFSISLSAVFRIEKIRIWSLFETYLQSQASLAAILPEGMLILRYGLL